MKTTMNAKTIVNHAAPAVNLLDAIRNDGKTAAALAASDAAAAMTAVCIGRATPAEYVNTLFKTNAARKLDNVTPPAAAVPVVVAIERAADIDGDDGDDAAPADYIRELMPARDNFDAVSIAHVYAAALADMNGTPAARTRVTFDIVRDSNLIMDAARMIATTTAKNAVMRECTETQNRIYAAARARNWCEHDLADLVQTAAAALVSVMYDAAADMKRRAAILSKLADYFKDIPAFDIPARRAAENAARRAARADDTLLIDICGDYSKVRARANYWTLASDAAAALAASDAPAAVFAARHAAFRALNNYLGDIRAIRTKDAPPALSLSEISDTYAAALAAAHDEKTAAALAARHNAISAALDSMPQIRRDVTKRAARGYGVNQTARALNRHHDTIAEHRKAAAADIRAALAAEFNNDKDAARRACVAEIIDGVTISDAAAALADIRAALAAADIHETIAAAVHNLDAAPRAIAAAIFSGATIRAAAAHAEISKSAAARHADNAAAVIMSALYAAADIDAAPPRVKLAALAALV